MPRTMDLQKGWSAFVDNLVNGASAWDGAKATPRRKTVAEDIFWRFAVGWENFISDWFIGAIITTRHGSSGRLSGRWPSGFQVGRRSLVSTTSRLEGVT